MSSHRQRSIALSLLILSAALMAGGCSSTGGLWGFLFSSHCAPQPSIPAGPSHGYRQTQWRAWEDGPMAGRNAWTDESESRPSTELNILGEPTEHEAIPAEAAPTEAPQRPLAPAKTAKPATETAEPAPLPPEPRSDNSRVTPFEDEGASIHHGKRLSISNSEIEMVRQSAHRTNASGEPPLAAASADLTHEPAMIVMRRWLRYVPCTPVEYEIATGEGTPILASPWPRRLPASDEAKMIRGVSFENAIPIRQQ